MLFRSPDEFPEPVSPVVNLVSVRGALNLGRVSVDVEVLHQRVPKVIFSVAYHGVGFSAQLVGSGLNLGPARGIVIGIHLPVLVNPSRGVPSAGWSSMGTHQTAWGRDYVFRRLERPILIRVVFRWCGGIVNGSDRGLDWNTEASVKGLSSDEVISSRGHHLDVLLACQGVSGYNSSLQRLGKRVIHWARGSDYLR